MTNREALQAQIAQSVPQATIELKLAEQGLNPADDYIPTDEANRKGIDLALAGIILYICLSPESVKELDYQLTQRDIEGLMRLRGTLLSKWDEPDPYGVAQITDISDLH